MLSARIVSGLAFAALFLLGLFSPAFAWALPLILTAAALWGVHECLHFARHKPAFPYFVLAMAFSVLLLADAYWHRLDHAFLIFGSLTVLTMAVGLTIKDPHMAEAAGISLMGTLYVALPLALIVLIWRLPLEAHSQDAQHYLIFLVIGTWASDVGAYTFGRLFGRHKLAPRVSPGKTIEGFIGGIVSTLIIAAAMKIFWNNMDRIFQWWEIIALALVFSTLGPIGDLAESWLKRSSGIKDSGRTFTGHGGMLDIIDSLLFTTIFYYGYLWIFHSDVII